MPYPHQPGSSQFEGAAAYEAYLDEQEKERPMRMVACSRCETPFDADHELGCAVPQPDGTTEIICSNCQEAAWVRHQEHLMETGGPPSLIEQQREAWRLK